MSDAIFHGWVALPERSVQIVRWDPMNGPSAEAEADLIPDWAAIAVAGGALIALFGFGYSWFTEKGWGPLIILAGLIIMWVGMREAERAIRSDSGWRQV
jgi:hypothetical protein